MKALLRSHSLLSVTLLAASALSGCGDDDTQADPDAGDDLDAGLEPDAAEPDAAPQDIPDPVPQMVRLSATGADGFNSVTYAPDGSFFAAGYTAATTTDRAMVVARFTPAGGLDTGWGNAGVVMVNVAVGGGSAEVARAVALQSTGKVVVAGIIEHDVNAVAPASSDRDGALFRLNADGTLDTSFDSDGILILDFNTGVEIPGAPPTWAGADDLRSVTVDAQDRLVIHGGQLTPEHTTTPARTDADWLMVRLTANGQYDTSFNGTGKFTLDILQAGASVRSATILADGSILGTGYSNTSAFSSTQPVIYKVNDAGVLQTAWGTGGFFHELVLGNLAEVYGVAVQGDKLVTVGYGKDTSTATNDWISVRLAANGTLDTTWGTDGKVRIDWGGFGDNGRAIAALPGGRVMMVGSGQHENGIADAKVIVLEGNGQYDADFSGDGKLSLDLGAASDAFWNVAVAPDGASAVVVGTRGVGNTQTPSANDDAAVMMIRLQ